MLLLKGALVLGVEVGALHESFNHAYCHYCLLLRSTPTTDNKRPKLGIILSNERNAC